MVYIPVLHKQDEYVDQVKEPWDIIQAHDKSISEHTKLLGLHCAHCSGKLGQGIAGDIIY